MAEQQESSLSRVSIPALVVITALAGGLFTTLGPLQSSRPTSAKQDLSGAIGAQDVDARLWQDPFQAMIAAGIAITPKADAKETPPQTSAGHAPPKSTGEQNDIGGLWKQVQDHFSGWGDSPAGPDAGGKNPGPKVTILLAMVSGGPYAEDTESRIRSRVAVVSGLNSCGYRSEDEEQIGYFTANWGRQAVAPAEEPPETDAMQLIIPYEWFTWRIDGGEKKNSPDQSNHVVVLWLRDTMFVDNPLFRLRQLIDDIQPKADPGQSARIVVLGPRNSTTLRAFLPLNKGDHPLSPPIGDIPKFSPPIEMYSWSATAMPALLVPNATPEQGPAQLRQHMSERGIDFTNVTCTDDRLAESLVAELRLRGCDPGDATHGTTIALVSEWDTFYGRTLPLTFAWMLAQDPPVKTSLEYLRADRSRWPSSLSTYSYLRGLDGITSDKAPVKKDDTKEPAASTDVKREVDRPEGTSQLDYVPRLGDQMLREHQQSLLNDKVGIRAIGVVGSDPYDKLLLLQALRPRFPDALFFTTDLDARFWHSKELRYTRNLIVASSFGLNLAPALQKSVPPFRDSYQTSQYLACLVAFGVVKKSDLAQISPRVFEIGRYGPVDLSGSDRVDPGFFAAIRKRLHTWQQAAGSAQAPASLLYPEPREHVSAADLRLRVLSLAIGSVLAVFLLKRLLVGFGQLFAGREMLEREIILKIGDIKNSEALMANLAQAVKASASPICQYLSSAAKFVLSGQAKPGSLSEQARQLLIVNNLNAFIRQHETAPARPAPWQRLIEGPAKVLLPAGPSARLHEWFVRPDIPRQLRNRLQVEEIAGSGLYACSYAFAATRRSLRNFAAVAWIPIAGFVALIALMALDHQTPALGDPFSWSDGVSVWPSEIIRLLVIVLTAAFIFRAIHGLKMNDLALSREFELPEPPQSSRPAHGNAISAWTEYSVAIRARNLWREYRWLGKTSRRVRRASAFAVVYLFAIGLLFYGFHLAEPPLMPVRGTIATVVNIWLLYGSIFAFTFLNFLVVDAARLCSRFIQNLSEAPTVYPAGTIRRMRAEIAGLENDDVDKLIDMKLIAGRSAEVSRMIYYPFITLLLLILARARFFDNWPWVVAFIFIFAMNAAWALSSALILQSGAKSAKAAVLKSLRARWVQLRCEKEVSRADRLNEAIKEIEELKSGALAGFSNNPLLGALSLPITGSAIAFLVNFLSGS